MTISLYNRNPLDVTCSAGSQALSLLVVDDQQAQQCHLDHDYSVFIELPDPGTPAAPQTTVEIHSNSTHDAYVWEQAGSGYTAWNRDSTGTSSRTITSPADVELQVAVVTAGSSPPNAPPAPGSNNGTLLKVKVRKKGDLPIQTPAGPRNP